MKKGDSPNASIEVIIRGYLDNDKYYEETILKLDSTSIVEPDTVKKALIGATGKMRKRGAGRKRKHQN